MKKEHCFKCQKKINVTTKFYCDCCSQSFCPEHRYIEAHLCSGFHKKIESERKHLQEALVKVEFSKIDVI